MGTFDSHTDSPDQVRQEGEELQIKFDRVDATTGTITWVIPPPADGCTSDNQAYCGVVVLLNTVPNQPVTTWPQNGTRYTGDPTGDADLHAGDKIGGALVVGAFYNDKTTTSISVSGLSAEQTYFVTGHITSCNLVYHDQGVSSYSLPYVYTQPTPDTSAFHEITINQSGEGVNGSDETGLVPGTTYCMQICIDGTEYGLLIDGSDAQTYDELVASINKELKLIENPPQGPVPPNTGAYYYETTNQTLSQWDGFQHNSIPVISEPDVPNIVSEGDFWLDSDDGLLYKREFAGSPPAGSPRVTNWVLKEPIASGFDPVSPSCDSFWYDIDDSLAYKWNGSVWCERPTFVQATDPSCPPDLGCGTYWFDETSEMLFVWDEETSAWNQTDAIVWDTNPTTLAIGTRWFNDTTNELFQYTGSGSPSWNQQTVVVSEETPTDLVVGEYWFQPSTQELFLRINLTDFVPVDVLIWNADPSTPQSCDLWWNTSTDLLFTWDSSANAWEQVQQLFIQTTDPSSAPLLEAGSVWVNNSSTPSVYWEWDGSQFVQISNLMVVEWPVNPITAVVDGTIWFDSSSNQYFERNGSTWTLVDPISSNTDPSMPSIGDFWFNTTNNTLNTWNGIGWVNVAYSTMPLTPSTGSLWFNTTEMELYEWDGMNYVVSVPQAIATLNDSKGRANPTGNIVVSSTEEGCDSKIVVGTATIDSFSLLTFQRVNFDFEGDLFESLTFNADLAEPVFGTDGISGVPMYDEVGVGTNGDPAMRRELSDSIRKQLGYPVVEVELTKYQLNEAIQSALEELRERSSAAYRRVFFFLDAEPQQQRYILTNKCVGFNTIVSIQGIHRVASAFQSTAYASGVYGQTVLQHLYHMGTFDLVSYHIVSDYIEQLEQLFATRIVYTWDEASRELFIPQIFTRREKLLVDCVIERTEQELLTNRYTKTWIERWAMAQARIMLAEIRGKYAALPGAGGGVALNAGELISRADIDMQTCIDDIDNFVVNDIENLGMGSELIIG